MVTWPNVSKYGTHRDEKKLLEICPPLTSNKTTFKNAYIHILFHVMKYLSEMIRMVCIHMKLK